MFKRKLIALFLVGLQIVTLLAPNQTQAAATTFEQQVNIIDQEYSTTSTASAPTDNSLGYFYWDSSKYSGTRTISLEVDGKTSATTSQITAALFDSSGTVVPQSKVTIGNANTIVTLDGCPECNTDGNNIAYTSTVLDGSGYPVISYVDVTNGYLRLVHCGNANCSTGNTFSVVDNSGNVGHHTSIALNDSGYPVISYRDTTNATLRLAVCGDANCASGNTLTVVDGTGCTQSGCQSTDSLGAYSSLSLTSTDIPVIAYYNQTDTDTDIVICANADCSSTGNTYTSLDGCVGCDTQGAAGQYASLQLDNTTATCTSSPKNCPVVVYNIGARTLGAGDGYDLKIARCTTNDCSAKNINIVDDGANATDEAGSYSNLALDGSGIPVITSMRGDLDGATWDNNLRFVHCDDVNCATETANVITLDGNGATDCASATTSLCDSGDVGWYAKIVLDSPNGYPVISYDSNAAGDLKLIHCNDVNCAGNNESLERIDGCTGCNDDLSTDNLDKGGYDSLVLDSNGYPVISYRAYATGFYLKLIHCGNANCDFDDGATQTNPTIYQRAVSQIFSPNTTAATTRTFTVRVWVNAGTGYIKAARLKIVQSNATSITDTVSQIELGNNQTITSTTYGELTDPKYYYYDTAKFSGTETAYFEATLKGDSLQGNGRVWSSGFELGDETADMEWDAIAGSAPDIDVQNTFYRSGGYALKIDTPTVNSSLTHIFATASQTAPYYFRTYLYVEAAPTTTGTVIFRVADSSANAKIGLKLQTDMTLDLCNLEDLPACASAVGSSSVLNTGEWYRIEMKVDTTTISATAVDARINGTSFASGTVDLSSGIARLNVGSLSANTALIAYFDDVAANNSTGSWPGPGKIIHLHPNAAGDNSGWTNTYANVDETTPDDAGTIVASNTAEATDDHDIEDISLAVNDDVNVVSIGARFNGAGASANASFVLRVKSEDNGTVEEGSTLTPANTTWRTNAASDPSLYSLTLYDLPGSSTTDWTDTTLDNAQIGYRLSSASTNNAQISTVWMLVDYTPNADLEGIAAQAKLQQCDESACSWTDVAGSEITSEASTFQRIRSSAITSNLTSGRLYRIAVSKSTASGTTKIANAKLIIEQTEAGGITDTELVHQGINTLATDTDSTYTTQGVENLFTPGNFSGATFAYYLESTMKTSTATSTTAYVQLYNITGSEAVSADTLTSTSGDYTRVRSSDLLASMPASAKTLDVQLKNSAAAGETTSVASSWLLIQMTPTAATPAPTTAPSSTSDASPPTCQDTKPASAPWLYAAVPQSSTSISLFFTPAADPVSYYALEFGTQPGIYKWGSTNIGGKDIRSYLVNYLSPNTTYYFRVRAGNGCAVGPWSNEISARISTKTDSKNLEIIDTVLEPAPPEEQQDQQLKDQKEVKQGEGYLLRVKVISAKQEPLEGVTVTLHSDVQEATTNREGLVEFDNVPGGQHKVEIAYNNYKGEEFVNLAGDERVVNLIITVAPTNPLLTPIVLAVIGVLLLIILVLIVLIIKKRKRT